MEITGTPKRRKEGGVWKTLREKKPSIIRGEEKFPSGSATDAEKRKVTKNQGGLISPESHQYHGSAVGVEKAGKKGERSQATINSKGRLPIGGRKRCQETSWIRGKKSRLEREELSGKSQNGDRLRQQKREPGYEAVFAEKGEDDAPQKGATGRKNGSQLSAKGETNLRSESGISCKGWSENQRKKVTVLNKNFLGGGFGGGCLRDKFTTNKKGNKTGLQAKRGT